MNKWILILIVLFFPVSICFASESAEDLLTDDLLISPEEEALGEEDFYAVKDFIGLGGGFEEEAEEEEPLMSPEEAVKLLVADPTKANLYAKFLSPMAPGDNGGYVPSFVAPISGSREVDSKYGFDSAAHVPQGGWPSGWVDNGNGTMIAPIVDSVPPPVFTPDLGAPPPSYVPEGQSWTQTAGGSWIAPIKE